MSDAFAAAPLADQDRLLAGAFARDGRRLRGFIRHHVADMADADDILQDVFSELIVLDDVEAALAELPAALREVFVAHELEGRSFASLAAESGTPVNTLLARKRYAVLHLRGKPAQHHAEL